MRCCELFPANENEGGGASSDRLFSRVGRGLKRPSWSGFKNTLEFQWPLLVKQRSFWGGFLPEPGVFAGRRTGWGRAPVFAVGSCLNCQLGDLFSKGFSTLCPFLFTALLYSLTCHTKLLIAIFFGLLFPLMSVSLVKLLCTLYSQL